MRAQSKDQQDRARQNEVSPNLELNLTSSCSIWPTDPISAYGAPRSPKAFSPRPIHPMSSEPSHQVRASAQLNLSIRSAIPNSPLSKRNCVMPVTTSNGLDEDDLEYNEPIQLMNKFDALIPEDQFELCKEGKTHEKVLISSDKEEYFELVCYPIPINLPKKLSLQVDLEGSKNKKVC